MDPLLQKVATFDAESGLSVPQIAVFMVFLTVFMNSLASTIANPVLPYYAREYGASNAAIGYLFAVWNLTNAVCSPMLGTLSDRFGRRSVLILSLFASGITNFGQAFATSFSMLFFMRGLSGVWAAVSSTAQVYLGDVCSPAVLPDYMAKVTSVPMVGQTFGPGLGGGLSKFGLNVPIAVNGALLVAAGVLCYVYLPESPVWEQEAGKSTSAKEEKSEKETKEKTPVPTSVYFLGCSRFFQGVVVGINNSMLAISLNAKLGLDSLQFGYTMAAVAIVTLCSGIWLTAPLQRRFGLQLVGSGSAIVTGIFTIAMAAVPGLWPTLGLLMIARMGISIRVASFSTMVARLTTASNRGSVYSTMQVCLQVGQLVGPIAGGHLAMIDPILLPWLVSGGCSLASAAVMITVQLPPTSKAEPKRLARGFSDLSALETKLEPEVGAPKDYEELGLFVGKLLSDGRYRWISHKEAVYKMLQRLLPQLSETAHVHIEDLERLMKHAELMDKEFGQHGVS